MKHLAFSLLSVVLLRVAPSAYAREAAAPLVAQSAVGNSYAVATVQPIATDAAMSRDALLRLLVRVHDAIGACLRTAHTRWDGDAA